MAPAAAGRAFPLALTTQLAKLWGLVIPLHVLAYLLSPLGRVEAGNLAFSHIALYVSLAIGTSLLLASVAGSRAGGSVEEARAAVTALYEPSRLLPVLFAVAALGVLLHLYAKLSVIELGDVDCLSRLRWIWLDRPRDDDPLHLSLASALGHILSTFAAVGLFVVGLSGDRLRRRVSLAWLAGFCMLTFLYAAAIVSRSVLLSFLMAFVLGLALCGTLRGDGLLRTFWRFGPSLAVAVLPFLGFAAYVFAERVTCGLTESMNPSPAGYIAGFEDELWVDPKTIEPSGASVGQNVLNNSYTNTRLKPVHDLMRDNCASCAMIAAYLSHGIWNYQSSLPHDDRPQWAFLTFAKGWLGRLGIAVGPDDLPERVYGLGAIALPGAAWYDFGLVGLVAVALLHGMFISAAGLLIPAGESRTALGLVVYACIGLVTLWSLLAFAVNTMSYPFLGFAFLMTAGGLLLRRSRIRQRTSERAEAEG